MIENMHTKKRPAGRLQSVYYFVLSTEEYFLLNQLYVSLYKLLMHFINKKNLSLLFCT